VHYCSQSPAIYVDARKASRFGLIDRKKNFLIHYLEPFSPEVLASKFMKKFKSGGRRKSEGIWNTSKGLYDYFTALNIKHKVKHPLFFAIRFHSSVTLYYNTNTPHTRHPYSGLEENLLYRLQIILTVISRKITSGVKFSSYDSCKKVEKAEFILLINEPIDTKTFSFAKTIAELFDPIQNDKILFLYDPSTIPSHFSALSHVELEKAYPKIYNDLAKIQESPHLELQDEMLKQPLAEKPKIEATQMFLDALEAEKSTLARSSLVNTKSLGSGLPSPFLPLTQTQSNPLLQQRPKSNSTIADLFLQHCPNVLMNNPLSQNMLPSQMPVLPNMSGNRPNMNFNPMMSFPLFNSPQLMPNQTNTEDIYRNLQNMNLQLRERNLMLEKMLYVNQLSAANQLSNKASNIYSPLLPPK
jgi:hypothetical protein